MGNKKIFLTVIVLLIILLCSIFFFKYSAQTSTSRIMSSVNVDTIKVANETNLADSLEPIQDKSVVSVVDTVAVEHLNSDNLRDSIVILSRELLGVPYVYAGTDRNGFDCSGFVFYVFRHFNIKTPRSSADFEFFGTELPLESVKKGDILLFKSPTREAIGHIGIVSNANGVDSEFIHATSSKLMQVVVSSASSEGYKKRFIKALRVIN